MSLYERRILENDEKQHVCNNMKYFYAKIIIIISEFVSKPKSFYYVLLCYYVLFIERCRPWWTPQGIPFLDNEGITGKIFGTLTIS